MSINAVVKAIKKRNKFLITSHIHPEGDAIGSELALGLLLKRLGKVVYIVNEEKLPSRYDFLPFKKEALSMANVSKRTDFEAAIVLDCPDITRIGKVRKLLSLSADKDKGTKAKEKIIVNIDHHISNNRFGDISWVDAAISSTGEMIYSLAVKLGCKIRREEAINLYVAILTDTGSFKFNNTGRETHRIAAELLRYGLDPNEIYDRIYEAGSAAEVKLLGLTLSGISLSDNGFIAWLELTRDILARVKEEREAVEGFVDFARAIRGVKVGILFTEKRGEVKVSLRSKGGIDVNKIAQFFGGGGHRAASGCMVKGSLPEVREKVLKKVREVL